MRGSQGSRGSRGSKHQQQLQQLLQQHAPPTGDLDLTEAAGGGIGDALVQLPIPKLNLQFLTAYDYLLRNFHLFRMEATYSVREDLSQAVQRIRPRLWSEVRGQPQKTVFTGHSRFALPLLEFKVTHISPPALGETRPAKVLGEIQVNLAPFRGAVREEWDTIREHTVLFLLGVVAFDAAGGGDSRDLGRVRQGLTRSELGVEFVRGCEVLQVRDELDRVVGAPSPDGSGPVQAHGDLRTLFVELDCAQYQADLSALAEGRHADDVYTRFNLVVRRKDKANNFKAVLSTIRDLMRERLVIPEWLQDTFLGYEEPDSASYWKIRQPRAVQASFQGLDFADTFLDADHVRESFPHYAVDVDDDAKPPFRLLFPPQKLLRDRESDEDADEDEEEEEEAGASIVPDYKALHALVAPNAQSGGAAADSDDEGNGKAGEKKKVQWAQSRQNGIFASLPALRVIPYTRPRQSPFPFPEPERNRIRLTPVQVEAVHSGLHHGLTVVVGPPGTGKTDTAVQIMANLYANFPEQRTLLVTHSNQALNDLFSKLLTRDIDKRHMLRLGYGAAKLRADEDFSKFGRVQYMLQHRIELLAEVAKLGDSLGHPGADVSASCETAAQFFRFHVQPLWTAFEAAVEKRRVLLQDQIDGGGGGGSPAAPAAPAASAASAASAAAEQAASGDADADAAAAPPPSPEAELNALAFSLFPFPAYFASVAPEFEKRSLAADLALARVCWKHLATVFRHLADAQPFELLRTARDRGDYLLTQHAKIIAMTCTHAAMRRPDLLALRFQYDNLVMEESAQVLEIETLIPMLLQAPDREGGNRLKRVVLLGDHHQLPPIVQNRALQHHAHLDQSMFARLVRLGVPKLVLNAQGRARPSIADLYAWRYPRLDSLPRVLRSAEYRWANAGLAAEFQLVNVDDFMGVGESSPNPFYYQNLGEAEYVVQLYMYMRLVGYPAAKITMLTTYNGQKHLLREVAQRRCDGNPLFGMPAEISTVDKYQGQQNDVILLSLVRTKHVGHLRDVRRLVVAMSRARLGLYVFARQSLFESCYELRPVFRTLAERPSKLLIVPKEMYPCTHRLVTSSVESVEIQDVTHLGKVVHQMTQVAHANLQHSYAQQQQKAFEYVQARKQAELEEEQARQQQQELQQAQAAADAARGEKRPRPAAAADGEEFDESDDDGATGEVVSGAGDAAADPAGGDEDASGGQGPAKRRKVEAEAC